LIAVAHTTSDTLLKSRTKLEETIRTILPSATSLQKEVQVVQVVIHNIPTTIPSTSEGYQQVLTEVQTFNPGTTLHRTPRWLTRPVQRENKAASSMVLSIVGRLSATEAPRVPPASTPLSSAATADPPHTKAHLKTALPTSLQISLYLAGGTRCKLTTPPHSPHPPPSAQRHHPPA
ncbi:hypothetical protein Q9L58_010867, partial [Maublancomyces gigas]